METPGIHTNKMSLRVSRLGGGGRQHPPSPPKSSVEWILLPVLDRETKVCKVKAPKTTQMMGDRARMQLRSFKFIGFYFIYYPLRLQGQRSLEEVVLGLVFKLA